MHESSKTEDPQKNSGREEDERGITGFELVIQIFVLFSVFYTGGDLLHRLRVKYLPLPETSIRCQDLPSEATTGNKDRWD